MPINWDELMPPPSDADRDARRADLVARARLVQRDGWQPYQYTWSTGEAVGVAVVLAADVVLTEFDETRETVLGRYAYDLFGVTDGRTDEAEGYPRTRKWFLLAQTELANPSDTH